MEQNLSIKKKILCEILRIKSLSLAEQVELCYNSIERSVGKILKDAKKESLKKRLENLKSATIKKIKESHSWVNTLRDNNDYFEGEFLVPDEYFEESGEFDPFRLEESLNEADYFAEDDTEEEEDLSEEQVVPDMEPSTSTGIKRKILKSYDNVSDRHKRRRVNEMKDSMKEGGGSLSAALTLALRLAQQQGDIEGAKMLKEYIKSSEKGEHFQKLVPTKPKQLDIDVAIGTMVYNNLSRNQYSNVQQVVKRESENIFPPAKKLLIAKNPFCYPENLTVDDTKAVVPLKDEQFHHTKRIIDAYREEIYEKIKDLPSSSNPKIIRAEMIVAWGMDGTTAQKLYNQARNITNNEIVNDGSLITVSTTMHQLRFKDENNKILSIWDNEKSQSVYSVRPIKIEFKKEDKDAIKDEFHQIQHQIAELGLEKFLCEDVTLEISYSYYPVMVDGKVYTIATGTSGMSVCQLCQASPNEMSDPRNLKNGRFKNTHENYRRENLKFNLQPLHTTSNVVKHLYALSFRKNVKKHSIRMTKKEKDDVKKETKAVKDRMWNAFNVRISEPRQGGVGTSDTGSVARKVLAKPELLAQTLGLDVELVTRISIILTKIRSHKPVENLDEFEKYCTETYDMFLKKYSWYKVPVTLHRALAHARDYMDFLPLPLGRMSEEAGESQNKLLRNDREFCARKTSRKDNLTDVIHRRFISSDPVILKKYMDVMSRKSKRNVQDENEISDQENEDQIIEDEVEIELPEPEGEGYEDGEDPEYLSEEECIE